MPLLYHTFVFLKIDFRGLHTGQQHLKFSEKQVKIVLKNHVFWPFLELRIFAFSVIYYHADSLKNYFRCIVRNNQAFTLF